MFLISGESRGSLTWESYWCDLKRPAPSMNVPERLPNIKRFETELKWIKLLQTPFPLGFNDNIYHEGNISKMPDFDVLTLS